MTTLITSSKAERFAGPNLQIVAGASTVAGRRRDHNEDASYISPDLDLFIVADGMGGHAAGEVASKFAVDVLSQELTKMSRDPHDDDEIEALVRAALSEANCMIMGLGDEPLYHGAATTVVLALLFKNRLFVTGIGDSRAYLIRGGSIEQLTTDDSFPQMLANAGVISLDEVKHHRYRNRLISSLGLQDFDPSKRIRMLELQQGDRLLLTSDGLTDVLEDDELLRLMLDDDNPQRTAETLVQHALDNDAGDDITCLVFHIRNLDGKPTSFSQRIHGVWQKWFGNRR